MNSHTTMVDGPATRDPVIRVPGCPCPTSGSGIATLGPQGTSSECAGRFLTRHLAAPQEVHLYGTYEEACAAVLSRRAARLLVANAYHGVCEFYMDRRLALELAFVFDTPEYGIAARAHSPVPLSARVATHPAPEALVKQLLPCGYHVAAVDHAASTSLAAAWVAGGRADLALTTQPAAEQYRLRFISATRPIRMLWSVFIRQPRTQGES